MNNEITYVEKDITDMMPVSNESGALVDINQDNILYLAKRADEYIDAMNKIMEVSLKITTEKDWVLIGGTPYLQESGATKVARLFGVNWQFLGEPKVEIDSEGYKTFTYRARFFLNNQFIECEGSRSYRDDFFAKQGKDKPLKKPDEIDIRDVKLSAYTNCINNGIKRLIPGLRNIDISTLEDAGLDVGKLRGYTFKDGTKGGTSKKAEDSGLVCEDCGKAITQSVASFSQSKFGKMLCMDCQRSSKNNE